MVASFLRAVRYGVKSCLAEAVSMMRSRVSACAAKFPGLVLSTKSWAPSFLASRFLPGDVLNTVTRAPIARVSFTAMWPSPPSPTTPTRCLFPILYRLSGEYVVIPAQRRDAGQRNALPDPERVLLPDDDEG